MSKEKIIGNRISRRSFLKVKLFLLLMSLAKKFLLRWGVFEHNLSYDIIKL